MNILLEHFFSNSNTKKLRDLYPTFPFLPSLAKLSAKEVDMFAKLNGYTIFLNCNNSFINRIIDFQRSVTRMLLPVKNLMIPKYLLSPCSVPDSEKVLVTQQQTKDQKTLPPMKWGAQRDKTMNNKHKTIVLMQSILLQHHMCIPKHHHAIQKSPIKNQRAYKGEKDRNLIKVVAQLYTYWVVKKHINTTIDIAVDWEKHFKCACGSGHQKCAAHEKLWSGRKITGNWKESSITPHEDRVCS